MSKHVGRKELWTEISPSRHDGLYGYIQKNTNGRWDGYVVYQFRTSLEAIALTKSSMTWSKALRNWRRKTEHCGDFKRAREAMMAVEQKAKEIKAQNSEDIII